MGITDCRKRSDAPGSIDWRAVIPREDMARLMDRCCAADFEDGRRRSGRPSYISTSQPCLASAMAQRQPTGPPPTTTALRGAGGACISVVCRAKLMAGTSDMVWRVGSRGGGGRGGAAKRTRTAYDPGQEPVCLAPASCPARSHRARTKQTPPRACCPRRRSSTSLVLQTNSSHALTAAPPISRHRLILQAFGTRRPPTPALRSASRRLYSPEPARPAL